jgi:anion-transporting  ArsA/GET3 family ATPase
VKQLERQQVADLIVLDAPAAGHAITFLQSANGLLDAVDVGPINTQARDVVELLSDPARTQVLLVTLAEETPVNELVETAFALEDRVGVSLGPVVVNGLYPDVALAVDAAGSVADEERAALEAAAAFRQDRVALQREQVERLGERLPLPQIHLPFLFTAGLTPADVDVLCGELVAGIGAL